MFFLHDKTTQDTSLSSDYKHKQQKERERKKQKPKPHKLSHKTELKRFSTRLLRNRLKYCCFTSLPKLLTTISHCFQMHVEITKLQRNVIQFALEVFMGDQNPHPCSCGTGAGSGEQSPRGRVSPGTQQSRVEKEGATPLQVAQTITQRRQPLH